MASASAALRARAGAALRLVAALAAAAVSAAAPTARMVYSLHDNRTIFGDAALALQGARDPVLMYTSWVYAPNELVGVRVAANSSWRLDTTALMQYDTLSVGSTRAPAASNMTIDSLLFWNEKPTGIVGQCALVGFNSALGPDLAGRAPGTWRANLSDDCINVNGATSKSWFAVSADGVAAVAFTIDSNVTFHYHFLDAQTGQLLWTHSVPSPSPGEEQGWLSYGVSISRDGKWVTFDTGIVGLTPQFFYVLDARNGLMRAAPVVSPGLMQPLLSDDGALLCSSDEPGPGAGAFSIQQWSAASAAYVAVGSGVAPVAPSAMGWYLRTAFFSNDPATNLTLVALAWIDAGIIGPSLFALYDANHVERGALSFFLQEAIPGSDYSVDDASVSCAEYICAAGLWSQQQDGPQPTVVVLSGRAANNASAPVLAFASRGSIAAVSVARAPGDSSAPFYVAAAGCSSVASCIEAGADSYLWEVSP